MAHFLPSSIKNPCPVCGRTKDGDCRTGTDSELVYCHTYRSHYAKGETLTGSDGQEWACLGESGEAQGFGIFRLDRPMERSERRSPRYAALHAPRTTKSTDFGGAPKAPPKAPRPVGKAIYHHYRDRRGKLHAMVRQYIDGGGKTCKWQQPLGFPETELYPYRWDDVLEHGGDRVFLTEGELDCDRLWQIGLPAVSVRSWGDWHPALFAGREVVIIPDSDRTGIAKAQKSAEMLTESGVKVEICQLPHPGIDWKNLPAKNGLGVYDWVESGGSENIGQYAIAYATPTPPAPIPQLHSTIDKLMVLVVGRCHLWLSEDRRSFADVDCDGIRQTMAIEGREFERWLRNVYRESYGQSLTKDVLTTAIAEADAMACKESRKTFLRTAGDNRRVWVDLADSSWQGVEVTADGWRVGVPDSARFVRPPAMRALPIPEHGGSLEEIREFLGLHREAWTLLAPWLAFCLYPVGPYPVAILTGPQGAGKSTLVRVIKSLIDPAIAPMMPTVGDDRNLAVAAVNRWLIAFDNLSSLSPWQSDALCRLSTGGGFSQRKLHTDSDEIVMEFTRPVVMNGIDNVANRSDLLSRAISIELSPPTKRVTEEDLMQRLERLRPRFFGAILDAMAIALKNLPTTELPDDAPRMAGFARFGMAMAPALGMTADEWLSVFTGNQQDGNSIVLETSPIAMPLIKWMEDRDSNEWSGSASELVSVLRSFVDASVQNHRQFPKDGTALGKQLARLAPVLAANGIQYTKQRTKTGRIVTLRRTGDSAVTVVTVSRNTTVTPKPARGAGGDSGDGGDGAISMLQGRGTPTDNSVPGRVTVEASGGTVTTVTTVTRPSGSGFQGDGAPAGDRHPPNSDRHPGAPVCWPGQLVEIGEEHRDSFARLHDVPSELAGGPWTVLKLGPTKARIRGGQRTLDVDRSWLRVAAEPREAIVPGCLVEIARGSRDEVAHRYPSIPRELISGTWEVSTVHDNGVAGIRSGGRLVDVPLRGLLWVGQSNAPPYSSCDKCG